MLDKKMELCLVVVTFGLISGLYISTSAVLIALILGILTIPPVLVLITIAVDGTRLNEKLRKLGEP